jgi:hypothetical protein
MIDAVMEKDDTIRVPVSITEGDVQGDGVATLSPGDDDYDRWKKYLDRRSSSSEEEDRERGLPSTAEEELIRWERKAKTRLKDRGNAQAPWNSDVLSDALLKWTSDDLSRAATAEDVAATFARARERFSLAGDDAASRKHFAYRWQSRRLEAEEHPLADAPLFDPAELNPVEADG